MKKLKKKTKQAREFDTADFSAVVCSNRACWIWSHHIEEKWSIAPLVQSHTMGKNKFSRNIFICLFVSRVGVGTRACPGCPIAWRIKFEFPKELFVQIERAEFEAVILKKKWSIAPLVQSHNGVKQVFQGTFFIWGYLHFHELSLNFCITKSWPQLVS